MRGAAVLLAGLLCPATLLLDPGCAEALPATPPAAEPTPARMEEDLLAVVGDDGSEEMQDLLRKGAHLIATQDLSELTDAMQEGGRVLQEALKDVAPADLQALHDLVANTGTAPPPAGR